MRPIARRYPQMRHALALLWALGLAACQPAAAPPPATAPAIVAATTPTAPATPAADAPGTATPVTATPAPAPAATLAPAPAATAPAQEPPAPFFHPLRLNYAPDFYAPQIQAFLDQQPGPLKSTRLSVGDRRHTYAEALVSQTSYYSISPLVILALIDTQSRLISSAGGDSGWAAGFRGDNGNWRGIQAQTRWAVKQSFYARRDFPARAPLEFADGSSAPPPERWGISEYVIARLLAPSTTQGRLPDLMERFRERYTALFDDPRTPPQGWPAPAEPFMHRPTRKTVPVTSFFDHDAPFLARDPRASVVTYWGRAETDASFAYDGHDGWDYAAASPDRALAAAAGLVVFAGNADDGCATRAVVLDHRNGYRTLYWHLARIDVEIGQEVALGEVLGVIGDSGCSLGPHLHFSTQFLGRNVDPYGWCGQGPDPWAQNPAGSASRWLWADRPNPCGAPPAGAVVVDTSSPGFFQVGDAWVQVPVGYGGASEFAPSLRGSDERQPWKLRPLRTPAVAVWRAELPVGRYRVLAYVPYALSGLEDPRSTEYRVRHAGGEAQVTINARTYANDWADLGTYDFDGAGAVTLSNLAEENQLSVWADAVMWVPADS